MRWVVQIAPPPAHILHQPSPTLTLQLAASSAFGAPDQHPIFPSWGGSACGLAFTAAAARVEHDKAGHGQSQRRRHVSTTVPVRVSAPVARARTLPFSFYYAIGFSSSSFPHHAQTATLPLWFRASHVERKRVNLFVHTHQTHHHIHTRCRNPPHTHPPTPTRNNRHTHADKPEGG